MDSSRPTRPTKPVFDVINPGVGAPPNNRPVFTNNQPQQTDPMMAPPSLPTMPMTAPPQPALETSLEPAPVAQSISTNKPVTPAMPSTPAEPIHTLQRQDAYFGHVGSHPKGKKVLTTLVALVVAAALGVGGWFFWNKQMDQGKQNKPAAQTTITPTVTEVPKDTTFTSKLGVFSVKNEYEWKVLEADLTDTYGAAATPGAKYGKTSFAINDKQSLVFDINPGGRGGDCQPKATEKAFTKGNTCSSNEIVSANKLSTKNLPTNLLNAEAVSSYVVTYKYMGTDDAKPFTLVGIQNTYKGADGKEQLLEVAKPTMGLYTPYTILGIKTGYIDIKIVDKDGKPTQLSDDDLEKVGIVLKTFALTN